MKALINCLNEKATLRNVEEHLKSLQKIRHFYDVVDAEEVDTSFHVSKKIQTSEVENRMLKKVLHMNYVNRVTKEYMERMLEAINHLEPYDRQVILYRYFYDMDEEEIMEELHYSSRKVWKDLKKAKINLAFLLGCEEYLEE